MTATVFLHKENLEISWQACTNTAIISENNDVAYPSQDLWVKAPSLAPIYVVDSGTRTWLLRYIQY
jgi:hypothetical protein